MRYWILLLCVLPAFGLAEPGHGVSPSRGRETAPAAPRPPFETLRSSVFEYLRLGRFNVACELIDRIHEPSDAWVCDADGWRETKHSFAEELLDSPQFTREAMEFCRHHTNAAASQMLREAVSDGYDIAELVRLVNRYPLSQAGMEALVLLGTLQLERGLYDEAAVFLDLGLRRFERVGRRLGWEPGAASTPRMLWRLAAAMHRSSPGSWTDAEKQAVLARLRAAVTPNGLAVGRRVLSYADLVQSLQSPGIPLQNVTAPRLQEWLDLNRRDAPLPLDRPDISTRELALALAPTRTRAAVVHGLRISRPERPMPAPHRNIADPPRIDLSQTIENACLPDMRITGAYLDIPTLYGPSPEEFQRTHPRLAFGFDLVLSNPSLLRQPLPGLQHLIYYGGLNDEVMQHIAQQRSLRDLQLEPRSSFPFSEGQIRQLAGLPSLRSLSLSPVSPPAIRAVGSLPALEGLTVGDASVLGGGEFAGWPRAAALRELRLYRLGLNRAFNTHALAGFTGLRELALHHGQISDTAFLRQMPALERLELVGFLQPPAGGFSGLNLPSLRHLNLQGSAIGDHELRAFSSSPLEELILDFTGITDESLEGIGNFGNLREVSLQNTNLRGSGLAALARIPGLQSLNLSQTRINLDDAQVRAALGGLTSLRTLYLCELPMQPGSLAALQRLLPNTQIITGSALRVR